METNPVRVARIYTDTSVNDLFIKSDKGKFKTIEEAEKIAAQNADLPDQDSIIVQDDDAFHVYGIDEMHPKMPVNSGARMVTEAPIISFVATDPLTGQEHIIGKSSSQTQLLNTKESEPAIDKYAVKFQNQLDKLLGKNKEPFLNELRELEKGIEANGVQINIELNDDVFESMDKLNGFKNFLTYTNENIGVLKDRDISKLNIVDEADGWWGVKIDLDYDKKGKELSLTLGDDYLSDWGESLKVDDKDSLNKLGKELGNKLTVAELQKRGEIFRDLGNNFSTTYQYLNKIEADFTNADKKEDVQKSLEYLEKLVSYVSKDYLPYAKTFLKNLSVDAQADMSLDQLNRYEKTTEKLQEQIKLLKEEIKNPDPLTVTGRIEKTKIFVLKGIKEAEQKFNSLSGSVSSTMNGMPGAGLTYTHSFNDDNSTFANINLGTNTISVNGDHKSDVILGLGFGHTFHSKNLAAEGLYAGVGVGFGRDTPFFVGANVSNSWNLNNSHGQAGELSIVGGAYATVGTYNNIGAYIDVNKKITSNIEFEGTGELSLFNQDLEAEAEFTLSKNKDVYLTAGVGTNKLLYAGVGIAGKYELEVGIGGVSFGKDSNNLPGETGWEVGIRSYLPVPYFKHHRVPGYQFSYGDNSKEYITPTGTFMTMKKDNQGIENRTSYVPEPLADKDKLAYRVVSSKEDLKNIENMPLREISVGPLGYLTVKENGKTLVDDGFITANLTNAELGIISDQAGVLWFDKMDKGDQNSIVERRKDMPLPLYRPVHF